MASYLESLKASNSFGGIFPPIPRTDDALDSGDPLEKKRFHLTLTFLSTLIFLEGRS